MEDLLKGNTPIYALIVVLFGGGGGLNVLSEGAEEAERDSVIEKFEEADFVQDAKFDALLALVNELRIEIAVLKERQEEQ